MSSAYVGLNVWNTQRRTFGAIIVSTNYSTMSAANMDLIQPNDPRYFTHTSDGSYDRHVYRIVMKDGRSGEFDDYEKVRAFWFEYDTKSLSHIEVLDVKNTVNGFGG
jgi:hypothetical protein